MKESLAADEAILQQLKAAQGLGELFVDMWSPQECKLHLKRGRPVCHEYQLRDFGQSQRVLRLSRPESLRTWRAERSRPKMGGTQIIQAQDSSSDHCSGHLSGQEEEVKKLKTSLWAFELLIGWTSEA